jgi:GTPase involved in cell partitioning and DNA repair
MDHNECGKTFLKLYKRVSNLSDLLNDLNCDLDTLKKELESYTTHIISDQINEIIENKKNLDKQTKDNSKKALHYRKLIRDLQNATSTSSTSKLPTTASTTASSDSEDEFPILTYCKNKSFQTSK